MKSFLTLFFIFSLNFSAYGQDKNSSWETFNSLDHEAQVKMLKSTLQFLKDLERSTLTDEFSTPTTVKLWQEKIIRFLMNEAYAGSPYNCFYAGWPSQTVSSMVNGVKKTYCTSPAYKNELYKGKFSKVCATGEMLCNPVLFGEKLCISVKTSAEKQLALSSCEKKFNTESRNLDQVLKGVVALGLESELKSLFDLVDQLCKNGFQSQKPMCRNLELKVKNLRAKNLPAKTEDSNKVIVNKKSEVIQEVEQKTVTVINDGKEIEENTSTSIVNTITKVDTLNTSAKILPVQETNCEAVTVTPVPTIYVDNDVLSPEEKSEPIDHNKELADNYCLSSGGADGMEDEVYFQGKYGDYENGGSLDLKYRRKVNDPTNKMVIGFTVTADNYGVGKPYVENYKAFPKDEMKYDHPARNYEYEFQPRGSVGTFTIVDWPVAEHYDANGKLVERYGSTSMHLTEYIFFPRKVVPSVKKRDDKVLMTMTTGEQMVFDAKTGKLIEGVAKDLPVKNYTVKSQITSSSMKHAYPNSKTSVTTYPSTQFSYQGQGIWIENKITNTNLKKPGNILPVKSFVNGKLSVCNMKSEDLFVYTWGYHLPPEAPHYLNSGYQCYRNKYKDDKDFYQLIKKQCPDFKFPALTEMDK